MLSKLLSKIIVWFITRQSFTTKDKSFVLNTFMKEAQMLPIHNVIGVNENGQVVISGNVLDIDKSILFKEGCIALQNSNVRKVIHDQLLYEAISMHIHRSNSDEQVLFGKVMIYLLQEEDKLINKIARS